MICGECHSEAVDPVKPGPEWEWCCRACFAKVDVISEALEREFGGYFFAPTEAYEVPLRTHVREDLTGHRFGDLVVQHETILLHGPNRVRAWLCRCACGGTTTVETYRLRKTRWCKACGQRRAARGRRGPYASRAFDGKVVSEIARDAGVRPQTIWSRILRGWPRELLAAPRRRPANRGNTRRAA